MEPLAGRRDARRRRPGDPLPAAEAVRDQAARQPHPPAGPGRRRPGRDDRRRRDRRRVDRRRRRTPTTGATPTSASAGPVVRGLQGAFAENWLEGTGEVLARRGLPARPRARRRRRADAARPLERQGRRHERRGALLPGDRLGAASRSTSPPPTSCPARRSPTRSAPPPSAASTSASSSPGRTSTRGSSGPPAGPPTTSCSTPACGSSSTSRRCCTRRRCCVDGAWSSVGTVNFDNRSFQLHDEVTLCVWDERFAGELDEAFERDLERSEEIEPERWRSRGAAPAGRRGGDHRAPPRALSGLARLSCPGCSSPAGRRRARASAAAGSPRQAPPPGARRARRRRPGRAALPAHARPRRAGRDRDQGARAWRASTARSGPGSAPSGPRSTSAAAASGWPPGSPARPRSASTTWSRSRSAASAR